MSLSGESGEKKYLVNDYFSFNLNTMFKSIYDSPSEFKKAFIFLLQKYDFKIIKESYSGLGLFIVYQNKFVKIGLSYDYRDNFFSFDIVKGIDTQYPNDKDTSNIKDFYFIIKKYLILHINEVDLQPNNDGYLNALMKNAEILSKYGHEILLGNDW